MFGTYGLMKDKGCSFDDTDMNWTTIEYFTGEWIPIYNYGKVWTRTREKINTIELSKEGNGWLVELRPERDTYPTKFSSWFNTREEAVKYIKKYFGIDWDEAEVDDE